MCKNLFFNEVAGLRSATLFKKRLQNMCFLVNFAKFLRTSSIIEHLRWLLLSVKLTSEALSLYQFSQTKFSVIFHVITYTTKKVFVFGIFQVRIFRHSDGMCRVQLRENTAIKTPNTDTFHAVLNLKASDIVDFTTSVQRPANNGRPNFTFWFAFIKMLQPIFQFYFYNL